MRIELTHPAAGSVPLVASPIRMSATPVQYAGAPPMLGQHTQEVLWQRLGVSVDEFARLRENGIA